MKAVVCKEFGPPEKLAIEDLDDPAAGRGEVLVRMRAAVITYPDTLLIENRYQFKAEPPIVPGSEVAGEVVAVGPGRLTDDGNRVPMELAVGDMVVYSKYAGTEYKDGDEEYLVLREDDILFKR